MGGVFLVIVTLALILFNIGWVWLIPLYFAEKRIRQARKNLESKKMIRLCYILIILTVILFLMSIYSFVVSSLQTAQ